MTMSAALDAGLAFSLVSIFFALIYPGWMDGFKWWGTEIYKQVSLLPQSQIMVVSVITNKNNAKLRGVIGRLAR